MSESSALPPPPPLELPPLEVAAGHATVRRPRGSASGFTLIEVVVALIIFALVFGAISRVIQTGFRQSRVADVTTEAALVARSLMERIGTEIGVGEGVIEGATGLAGRGEAYRYRIEMTPVDIGQVDPVAALMRVVVDVRWGDGPADGVALETLRIAPLEE